MSRETKIGLLVSVGIILLIGIVVTDHYTPAHRQKPANLAQDVRELTPTDGPSAYRRPVDDRRTVDRRISPQAGRVSASPAPRSRRLVVPEPAEDPVAAALSQHRTPPQPAPPERTRTRTRARADRQTGTNLQGPGYRTEIAPDGVRELILQPQQPSRQRPATPSVRYHTLGENQTLSDVAAKYYGSAKHWPKIYKANKDRIANPDFVKAGTRLRIPLERPAVASTADATQSQSQPTRISEHTVRDNQTLSEIAAIYYGSSKEWEKLYRLNKDRIRNPDRIRAGLVLRVPKR
ncbi:MAG: LysM peptidoglycan-binding domain-containing protein [Phycisphaeraceae bacterium]|nr:LysM peptidoglycan-binding domain-containing protein [Phycisphaeraceae bacterium]